MTKCDECLEKEVCGAYRKSYNYCPYEVEHLSRKEFLSLPIEEQRKRLTYQVNQLLDKQAMEYKDMC